MPLDASIVGGLKPFQIESPVDNYSKMLTLQNLMRQNQTGDMQMQEAQRAQQDRRSMADLYRTSTSLDGTLDQKSLISGMARAGQGANIPALQKTFNEQAKAQREAEKAHIESSLQKLALGAQLMGGVKDQGSYDAARTAAQGYGLDVSKMPPQYDPVFIQQKQTEGQGVKEQLEQKWKAMEYSTPKADAVLQASQSGANNTATVGATDRATQGRISAAVQKTAPKPLPAAALKMQMEGVDAISTASGINADLSAIGTQIDNGTLKFGPVGNLANRALNAGGMSTKESRNFASFQANMEKLRNDSLRLNKGVQTDGDAQRAWNELFSNINDTKVVQQRLGEIKRLNERAVELRKLDIDNIRANYGHEPMSLSGYQNQPPALNEGKPNPEPGVKPKTKEFIHDGQKIQGQLAPDGKYYIKLANGKYSEVTQ